MILAPTAHHKPGKGWHCSAAGSSDVLGGVGWGRKDKGLREIGGGGRGPRWAEVSHSDGHSTITEPRNGLHCAAAGASGVRGAGLRKPRAKAGR